MNIEPFINGLVETLEKSAGQRWQDLMTSDAYGHAAHETGKKRFNQAYGAEGNLSKEQRDHLEKERNRAGMRNVNRPMGHSLAGLGGGALVGGGAGALAGGPPGAVLGAYTGGMLGALGGQIHGNLSATKANRRAGAHLREVHEASRGKK
jgi:hypothetical protein